MGNDFDIVSMSTTEEEQDNYHNVLEIYNKNKSTYYNSYLSSCMTYTNTSDLSDLSSLSDKTHNDTSRDYFECNTSENSKKDYFESSTSTSDVHDRFESSVSTASNSWVGDFMESSFHEQETPKNHAIIDCCTYSITDLYLVKDGTILCGGKKVNTNRHLKALCVFDGILYGIDKKKMLYMLDANYYGSLYWVFIKVKWFTKPIDCFSSTLDGNYLWVKSSTAAYLLNDKLEKTKCSNNHVRVYGKTMHHYIEFDHDAAHIYIDNKLVETRKGVKSGVIDYKNNVFLIKVDDKQYKDVKILKHKPYYIKA